MANETTITTSKQYSLDWKDLGKGLIVAIVTPALVIIQNSIDAGSLVFNWKVIAMSAIGGGVAYLIKNFFTPAQTVIKPGTPEIDTQ